MREPLILSRIKAYEDSGATRLHMPGHKGNVAFKNIFPSAGVDITELSFSGCLESGEGVVRKAEENVAEILSAGASHMVTDGSTSAILSLLYAMRKMGDKVIIPRISHKSVYNALKLFGLEPIFLECDVVEGIPMQRVELLEDLLKIEGVAGVMLTSPDYYGLTPNLPLASALCKKAGKLLFVDGAHGGHLAFCDYSLYAGGYADAWVDGVHKTLPCLTQAAVLNVNNEGLFPLVEEGLGIFRTTSPSYPIMASIEYGVYYAEAEGKIAFERLFSAVDNLKADLIKAGYVFLNVQDRAKVVLDCEGSGVDCNALVSFMEEEGVFIEFADGRYAVMMVSLHTEFKDLERLKATLLKYRGKNTNPPQNTQKLQFFNAKTTRATGYLTATNAVWELVSIADAVGRVSAINCGFFPPCYPIITAGEVFTQEIVCALANSENVFGLTDGKIKVVKGTR